MTKIVISDDVVNQLEELYSPEEVQSIIDNVKQLMEIDDEYLSLEERLLCLGRILNPDNESVTISEITSDLNIIEEQKIYGTKKLH